MLQRMRNDNFGGQQDYFCDLKNYLDITFEDPDLDQKLGGICRRAESYLSQAAGKQIYFGRDMEDQNVLQLLFDCIRYIWNNSLDEFGINYQSELMMLRANTHIDQMEMEDEQELSAGIYRWNCNY